MKSVYSMSAKAKAALDDLKTNLALEKTSHIDVDEKIPLLKDEPVELSIVEVYEAITKYLSGIRAHLQMTFQGTADVNTSIAMGFSDRETILKAFQYNLDKLEFNLARYQVIKANLLIPESVVFYENDIATKLKQLPEIFYVKDPKENEMYQEAKAQISLCKSWFCQRSPEKEVIFWNIRPIHVKWLRAYGKMTEAGGEFHPHGKFVIILCSPEKIKLYEPRFFRDPKVDSSYQPPLECQPDNKSVVPDKKL